MTCCTFPIFKGVKIKISTKGEGGEALVRGEGDMALQLSCEILNHPELEQVGLVPEEAARLYGHRHGGNRRDPPMPTRPTGFIAYLKSPEAEAVLKAKGMVPAK